MLGLYLLDICILDLMLNKETYIDTAGSTLTAKVIFINFPALEITERNRFIKDESFYMYQFNSGQSCHFSISTEELVKKMKRIPLTIGVYRVDDIYPICYTRTHLTGCACDLGTLKVKEPSPFIFRGPFDLFDAGNNFSGQLNLEITITNMGRCMMTQYGLGHNCFYFKNKLDGPEYRCTLKESSSSRPFGSFGGDLKLDTVAPGNLIKGITAIAPVARRLVRGRPPPKPPREPLVDPRLSSRRGKRRGKKR